MSAFGISNELLFFSGAIVAFLLLIGVPLCLRLLVKQVGPHQVLLKYGRRGTTIVIGGAVFVNPLVERYEVFPLDVWTIAVSTECYTVQGIALTLEVRVQIKVVEDPETLRLAVALLSKSDASREQHLTQLVAGSLRRVVGSVKVEDVVRNSDYVCEQLATRVGQELQKLGMICLAINMMQVSEASGYLEQLGSASRADLSKQVTIAVAQAHKDAEVERALAAQEAAQIAGQANQKRVQADFEAKTREEELKQQFELTSVRLRAQLLAEQARLEPMSGEDMEEEGKGTRLLADA
jgi:flotillin